MRRYTLLLVAALAIIGAACSGEAHEDEGGGGWDRVSPGFVGLEYAAGTIEAEVYEDYRTPADGTFWNGWGDKLYQYPSTQREYIVSSIGTADQASGLQCTSSDGIDFQVEIHTPFFLDIAEDRLQTFHEDVGLKFTAWKNEGWNRMLSVIFLQPIEGALLQGCRQFTGLEIYAPALLAQEAITEDLTDDEEAQLEEAVDDAIDLIGEIERSLSSAFNAELDASNNRFFCGPGYVTGGDCPELRLTIKGVDTQNQSFLQSIDNVVAAQQALTAQRIETQRQTEEARGILELNNALQQVDDSSTLALLRAIEAGTIDFWVIPADVGLTIPTPGVDND